MERTIDINSDVGERAEALRDGSEEQLISMISSANVACGGHAGDSSSMTKVIEIGLKYGVSVGAHPGYPDKADFGRTEMAISDSELERSVYDQVASLGALAEKQGIELHHVKPHGALYNAAAKNTEIAAAIGKGVGKYSKEILLVGLAGSAMLRVWKEMEFRVAAEGFGDRVYEPDGTLRSRKFTDALITDPQKASDQVARMVMESNVVTSDGSVFALTVQTICVHSDTPNAIEIVKRIRKRLEENGVALRSMTKPATR